jgi:hypothetical protein
MENTHQKSKKGGRKPKQDPSRRRDVFYLNETEHCKLNGMYLQSGKREFPVF